MSQATLSERPYVNSNLFTGHYLDERVQERDEWDCDDEARQAMDDLQTLYGLEGSLVEGYGEDALIDNWIDEVLDVLGFGTQDEVTLPGGGGFVDELLFETPTARRDAAKVYLDTEDTADLFERGVGIVEAKQWDAAFDVQFSEQRPYRNASHQTKHYLENTPPNIQWGILTNGRKWRLYGTNDYETQTYYEVDLPELLNEGDLDAFKYFFVFFRPNAFRESAGTTFLDEVWSESETASQELGEDLQDNVFTALRVLGRGFTETNDLNIDPDDEVMLDELKEQSLVLLYRLMFVLYAEARGLIHPEGQRAQDDYEENFSLDALRLNIHQEIGEVDEGFEEEFSTYSTGMWSRLEDLFRLIDEGEEDLGIPPYNGGLFDHDEHNFLADHEVSNRYLAEVIYRLSTTQNDEGRYVLADYADLDTRHLGSVYEGLLEHQFRIAPEQYAAVAEDGSQVWKPATDVSVADAVETVSEGELYVVNDEGERKATGAYYTPDYVVTYMIEETVGPLVEEIREDLVDQGFEPGTQEYIGPFFQRVTDLRILDPAMGSGHFLTKATGYLSEQVMTEVRKAEEEFGVAFNEQHIRREIAKDCIYGVDLNGMAVELAKLSMWLETLAADRPLAFLDHHFKQGNSLVGSDITEVLSDDTDEGSGQLTLMQAAARARKDTLEHVMDLMQDLLAIDSQTLEDIKSMEELYDEIREDPLYQRLFEIANVHTAEEFGLDISEGDNEEIAGAIQDADEWAELQDRDWFRSAQAMADDEDFFHWELEYPEVFFGGDGEKSEDAGFDAVIGNPPYIPWHEYKNAGQYFKRGVFRSLEYDCRPNHEDSQPNIYLFFLVEGLRLSKNSVSYILPQEWLDRPKAMDFRDHLVAESSITLEIFDEEFKVFNTERETVGTNSLLVFASKPTSEQITGRFIESLQLEEIQHYFDTGENSIIDQHLRDVGDVTGQKWTFSELDALLSEITRVEGVEQLGGDDFKTGGGFQPPTDLIEYYTVTEEELEMLGDETEYIYPALVESHQMERYHVGYGADYWILLNSFDSVGAARQECPLLLDILETNKEELKSDHEDWWKFPRVRNFDALRDADTKLVTPRTAKQNSFALDNRNSVFKGTNAFVTSQTTLTDWELLGIINSRLMTLWHSIKGSDYHGHNRYEPGKLKQMPIITEGENLNEIGEKAREIQETKEKMYDEISAFLNWITTEWGVTIDDLSLKTHLREYWEYDFDEMLRIAKKNSNQLDPDPSAREFQERLKTEWESSLDSLNPLQRRIKDLERDIDALVFEAYDLNTEQLQMVLNHLEVDDETIDELVNATKESS
jgi:type I restriction-modification system DNA methylase subunit